MTDGGEQILPGTPAPEASARDVPPGAPEVPERRRSRRYACEGRAEVFLPHGGTVIRGRILNVSSRGCFIEAPNINFERGTHVEVFFESKQLQLRVAGSVAILNPRRGVGIAFLHLSVRIARQLQELIRQLSEDDSEPVFDG
jgi:hypothetical protein